MIGGILKKSKIKITMLKELIGKKVLIRAYSAGVHFGALADISENGDIVKLTDTRRVHYWEGAASLSQMALEGVKKPSECRFSVVIPENIISGVIERIPLSEAAIVNLESVPVWKV